MGRNKWSRKDREQTMKYRVFLRPHSFFMHREDAPWYVDIYDGRNFYVGGYHMSSKKLATKLAKYIRRKEVMPAVSMAGTWRINNLGIL